MPQVPAKTEYTPKMNEIDVHISKTGGKAQTIVNIYVNNALKRSVSFNNGNYTRTNKVSLNNVKNKKVRVDIVNQSTANKFKYSLKFKGEIVELGSGSGNLAGQSKKTFQLECGCKSQTKITVRRTGGNARANVFVRLGSTTVKTVVIDKNQSSKTITLNNANGKCYKVEVKNVSVGNWFKFNMTAKH